MAAKTSPLPPSLKLWEQTHGSPREGFLRSLFIFKSMEQGPPFGSACRSKCNVWKLFGQGSGGKVAAEISGHEENQFSDGGDSVRNLQAYLHPDSEHWLDWFHITMRITVLQQQVKALKNEQPKVGEEVARELESIKHFLWHGNTFQALQRLEGHLIDLEFPEVPSPLTQKVAKGIGEFETYIRNNEEFIPNFGERYRNGETISTAFVESTVNQVIRGCLKSPDFVKFGDYTRSFQL